MTSNRYTLNRMRTERIRKYIVDSSDKVRLEQGSGGSACGDWWVGGNLAVSDRKCCQPIAQSELELTVFDGYNIRSVVHEYASQRLAKSQMSR